MDISILRSYQKITKVCPLIKKKVVDFNKKKFKLCPKLCYSAIQPRVQACLVRSQVDEEEEEEEEENISN